MITHLGGCHCGNICFEIDTAETVTVQRCNCSMCSMTGFIHLIVPARHFRLLKGEDKITTYQFNTKVAKHLFCSICGVKSFYVPRSNPDGYSINVNCIQNKKFTSIQVEDFDGQNWEANAASLSHLSK